MTDAATEEKTGVFVAGPSTEFFPFLDCGLSQGILLGQRTSGVGAGEDTPSILFDPETDFLPEVCDKPPMKGHLKPIIGGKH